MPQGPTAASLKSTTTEKVKDNLYVITGSSVATIDAFSGGNTAVFVTDKGVILVDTKLPGWGQPILDRIKTGTDKPVTTSSTPTPTTTMSAVTIFSARQSRPSSTRTQDEHDEDGGLQAPEGEVRPEEDVKDKLTLGSGRDQVDLNIPVPATPTAIRWRCFRRFESCTGDMFARKALPYIDTSNGGNVVALAETLGRVVSTIKNVDTVITATHQC